MVETASAPAATVPIHRHSDTPVLELNGVSHEYGNGTPWATRALRDINFAVHEGDGVLIHGLNGSGKSTLAWIMAGLTVPTAGTCLLDGTPVSDQVGGVAISFQAARLQLMRSHVDLEIASAAGFSAHDQDRVSAALATVGLDPALATRRIDQLSGGQMRRVVLAGLLARSPRALILDEPLAGLDAASQRGLLRLLEDLRRRAGLTVVVISHDFSGLEDSVPAHAAPARRGPGGGADRGGRDVMTAPAPTRRQRKPVVLLRPVPGDSVIHQLWAGTKLLVVAGIGVLLTFYPGWVPIGLVAALVLAAALLARIPCGALPSIPRWLWILLFLGGVTATFAGGSPVIDLGSVEVGLGGLFNFLRITALSIVLLGLGAMVSWTTNVAEIAPAVATLGRPLRALRIPVDDWAVALALALRAFPMLIDEFRVLYAARRLRPGADPSGEDGGAGGVGGHRPARSHHVVRCGGPMRWATPSPRAAGRARSRPRRRGRRRSTRGVRDRCRGLRRRACARTDPPGNQRGHALSHIAVSAAATCSGLESCAMCAAEIRITWSALAARASCAATDLSNSPVAMMYVAGCARSGAVLGVVADE